jgi:hypothetical protein
LNPAPENLAHLAISRTPERKEVEKTSAQSQNSAKTETSDEFKPFGEEGFFGTLLDIINPLQNIPVVSTIYRSLTGDESSPFSRVVGGALFGGPIGVVASVIDVLIKEDTGKDIGQHTMAAMGFGEDEKPGENKPILAEAKAPSISEEIKKVETAPLATLVKETAPDASPIIVAQSAPLNPPVIARPDFIPLSEGPKFEPPAVVQSPLEQQAKAAPLFQAASNDRYMPIDQNRPGGVKPGSNRPAPTREAKAFPIHGGPRERIINMPANDPKIIEAVQAQAQQTAHPMLTPNGSQDPNFVSQAMMGALEKYQKSAFSNNNANNDKAKSEPPS